MKSLFRHLLINMGALWMAAQLIPGLRINGGLRGLLIGALALLIINFLLVPLIRVLLLPLNLLTLGIFAWLTNVLALYFLVTIVPTVKIYPYTFDGLYWGGFVVPSVSLSSFEVTIVSSLVIGVIAHFIYWLVK